jgi:hypothetical protein
LGENAAAPSRSTQTLSFMLGGIVAASLCWVIGRRVNTPNTNHTVLFIPMQYYAFFYLIIFGCLAFNPQFGDSKLEAALKTRGEQILNDDCLQKGGTFESCGYRRRGVQ